MVLKVEDRPSSTKLSRWVIFSVSVSSRVCSRVLLSIRAKHLRWGQNKNYTVILSYAEPLWGHISTHLSMNWSTKSSNSAEAEHISLSTWRTDNTRLWNGSLQGSLTDKSCSKSWRGKQGNCVRVFYLRQVCSFMKDGRTVHQRHKSHKSSNKLECDLSARHCTSQKGENKHNSKFQVYGSTFLQAKKKSPLINHNYEIKRQYYELKWSKSSDKKSELCDKKVIIMTKTVRCVHLLCADQCRSNLPMYIFVIQ